MQTAKKCVIFLAVLAMLCCVLVGCRKGDGEVFGFTLPAEPKQIDPQVAEDAASLAVVGATFEGLVREDENGDIVPAAADFTVSKDGKTYTFTLKESCWSTVTVKGEQTGFEDPIVVTAYDFVFGIRRTADKATASPHAAMLAGIVNADKVLAGKKSPASLGVKAVDEKTLTITLEAAEDDFLERLLSPAFLPCNEAFFEYTRGRYGLEKQYILTNGAFYVSGWEHAVSVSLRKNEHYHAAADVLPAAVKYRVTTSADEDFELLKKGGLDAAFVPKAQIEAAKKAGITLVGMEDTVLYLWFNHQNPVLKNSSIRKALACAVEWDTLFSTLPEDCAPSNHFFAPAATVKGATEDMALAYGTDKKAAAKQFAKGAAALGLQATPSFTLLAANDGESADVARYILQSFSKNLSLQCTLELVEPQTLEARVKAGNYELALYALTGNGLSAKENLKIFTSSEENNYARYKDRGYDALFKRTDDTAADVQRLENHLFKAVPVLPIGYYTRYYGVRKGVTGVTVYPFNGGRAGATVDFRKAQSDD